ncbi:hypothetical protein FPCIR_10885 [Fusarium pseudocircinatum]|uniref:Apple domain-containing protein n=1 Tax=Fusarium pseudocircinatum TaxID=56676 RepID=A0A8H5KW82_9HYPO|nr:hypothetical protein FPCIR_10885 [Fusarium pseudocircinatum]
MALLLSPAPTTTASTTIEAVSATTSAASGPTSCEQLDSPASVDGVEFNTNCGWRALGNPIEYSNQLHSFTECMAFCADTLACRALNFYHSSNECYLYESFSGLMQDLDQDMAYVISRPAVSTTTEAPTEISTATSLPASSETSAPIESASESTASTEASETTPLSSSLALTSETTLAGSVESSSFTTTSGVTSEATTSLPTTSSPFTSLLSSQDTPSGTTSESTSDSTLQSTLVSTSASAAPATTSLEAISSSTELSASASTDFSSLSSESVSESTTDIQSVSTSAEESTSLEPTTVATSTGSLHTDTSSIEMSTAETLTTETTLVETSAITNSATAIKSTSTGSGLSDTSRFSTEIQSTSDASALPSSSESSSPSHSSQTDSSYSLSSFTTRNTASRTLSVSDITVTETNSATCLSTSLPTATAIHTAYSTLTIDHAYTKTRFAETVTTVTYTTVNPSNPTSFITTCVPITLLYSPCGCKNQVYPTVDMTTVACTQGGDIVTLTVPKAVCETDRASYTHPIVQYPSGWVGGHQTDAGGNGYPTGGSQPGAKNGQPEHSTVITGIQDSHPSYKTHQAVAPTPAGASNGYKQPEQGNQQPSVPAQGSAESNSNSPANPSQPSTPKSLTTETSIIPTPQLGNSALPSQPSSLGQGQAPSESTGAPYTTSVVVSDAHRYDFTSWITITTVVAMALLL